MPHRSALTLLATALLLPAAPTAARAQQPDARFTTRDLWVVYTKDQKAFAAQWFGKTLEVTGPLWATHVRAPGTASDLHLSVNGVAPSSAGSPPPIARRSPRWGAPRPSSRCAARGP